MKTNKIFMFIFLCLFLISFTTALEVDNIKDVKPITLDKITFNDKEITDFVKEYPKIEIDNRFNLPLIGNKLFEGYLSQHDSNCGQECESTMEIKTYGDVPLVQDVYFETILEDGSRIRQDVRSYQFYIKTNQEAYEVEDYEYQCTPTGKISINGTAETSCENVLVGTHTEYKPLWERYNVGEILSAGVYTLKIEADKKPSRTVDWVIKTNGEWLGEWATWGGSSLAANTVAYWKLDNNNFSSEIGSYTLSNSGTINTSGIIIDGRKLDGASDGLSQSSTDLNINYSTIAGWVNITNFVGSSTLISKMADSITGSNLYELRVETSGKPKFLATRTGGTSFIEATSAISLNEWHQLAGVSNETGLYLYIDGQLNASVLNSNPVIGGTRQELTLGYDSPVIAGDRWFLNGEIDEIVIFNTSLTSEDISFLYNSGTPGSEQQYPFSTGTVTLNSPEDASISDSSLITFNATATVTGGATLTNMSLWTNETGSWALRNTTDLTPSPLEINYQASYPSSGSSTGKIGLTFTPKENIIINNLTKYVSTTADTAYIQTAYGSGILDSASFSGDVATFTGDVTLTAGTKYWLLMDNSGASYNIYYNGATGSYPLDKTDLWINNSVDESGSEGNIYYSVVSFNTQEKSTTSTQTWNRTITDDIIWNVQACDSDGDCGWATSNYSLNIDTTAPTITMVAPPSLVNYGYNGQNTTLSYQVNDSNLDSCWYDYNGTNITAPCTPGQLNVSYFTIANGDSNLTFYANDSVGNLNSSFLNWTYKVFTNSFIFNNETRAGDQETFSMNITLGNGLDLNSVTFHYNDYSETPEIYSSGQERIFNITDYAVPLYQTDTNVTLFFNLVLDDATDFNTTNNTQLVQAIFLDNCSTYTNQLFNISLFDEQNKSAISGDIEFNYELLNVPSYGVVNSLNLSFTDVSNASVCSDINLTGQNFVQSIEIRYVAEGYAPELYHIQRSEISPNTTTINLYDLNTSSSTEFKLTYQDDTFTFVEGAVVQLLRKYISENLYRVVEAPLTSNEGVAVVHVDLDSIKYKIIVVKNGVVLDTFDNIVFKCQSELTGECEQKLLGEINPQNDVDLDTARDFTYSIAEANNTITVTYSIPSSSPSTVNLQLEHKDQFGNSTLCNQTITSSAGSIECTYEDTIGDSFIELNIYKDGTPMAIKTYFIEEEGGVDFLDNNFFIVFILLLSIIGMAISSPEWIIVNSVVTLVIAGSLWLLNGLNFVMGFGGLMWLLIASAMLIFKLAKQEDR